MNKGVSEMIKQAKIVFNIFSYPTAIVGITYIVALVLRSL